MLNAHRRRIRLEMKFLLLRFGKAFAGGVVRGCKRLVDCGHSDLFETFSRRLPRRCGSMGCMHDFTIRGKADF